jgi:bifunctional non-homologous end joining protein LigD
MAERAGELSEYRAKRDFRRTPEPDGDAGPPGKDSPGKPSHGKRSSEDRSRVKSSSAKRNAKSRGVQARGMRFVIHEHHARRLHWDLRLEHDGTLMSWAIPNGIPQDPRENRKAIHVEDHPLSYIDFEGEIPAGSYGAGRVLIWDSGTYDCEKLQAGRELIVVFHGERLQGRYALFRTGGSSGEGGGEEDWMIHRMDPPLHPREAMPEHLTPMLARPGRLPSSDDGWAYEIKWDGIRAISYWRPGRMRIESRNLNDVSSRYPELRALTRRLGAREVVLDGEIVAFDEQGRPSFGRLQTRMNLTSESVIRRRAREVPVTYVIFDLLYLEGQLTTGLSYRERRTLLEQLDLDGGPSWQVPAYHEGDGRAFLRASAEHNLEGILAKRLTAPYRPGERTGEWLKIKNTNRQELVIGGWLQGKGNRAGRLGALLVGYYEADGRKRSLRYAGRVGTGFDEPELERLTAMLIERKRRSSPFGKQGVQPPRDARFVTPELVAEIEFSRWTADRILRHSVYQGLRPDKPAIEVELETPISPAADETPVPPVVAHSRRGREPRRPKAASQGQALTENEGGGGSGQGRAEELPYRILRETKRHTEIEVQDRTLRLSNRDKLMYPESGFTKGQLIDYYAAVAPVLLGHLAGRPLTLKRYPDGVEGKHFYEKHCPSHRPEWVRTASIYSEREQEQIDYCVVEDLPTLIWVANLAGIELHPSLSRAHDIEVPTALVFDLDPGPPAGLRECCKVALWIQELFDSIGLQSLAKTSGAKGLQVYVPLNTHVSYARTKPLAHAVARLLEREHPKLVLSRMNRSLRTGKVLIDWSQNDQHKTTVCVYSLRARERPMVSTPLTWEEVQRGSRRRSREVELSAEPRALLERVERDGDLFAPLLSLTQTLPELGGGSGESEQCCTGY